MSIESVQAMVAGENYELTAGNEPGEYTMAAQAPVAGKEGWKGYYPVTLRALDDDGNITIIDDTDGTFGKTLRLMIKQRLEHLGRLISTSLIIDNDSRTIAIPEDVICIGVEGDKDVNILEFTMPATYGDMDLSEYDIVIQYENIERGRMHKSEGTCAVLGAAIVDDQITFSWVVGEEACRYHGITRFSVCLINGGNNIFHTRWACLPVLRNQIGRYPTPDKYVGDIIIDLGNVGISVEDEILMISEKTGGAE